jgi:ABC-type sugar transport system permease subunit
MIGFLLFLAFPVVAVAVHQRRGMEPHHRTVFVGINNFITLFQTPISGNACGTPPTSACSRPARHRDVPLPRGFPQQPPDRSPLHESAIFLPVHLLPRIGRLIWQWILDNNIGMLNRMLSYAGIVRIPCSPPAWSMPSVIIVSVWRPIGYNMVIFLAALQGVPIELYEAADIDGAGPCAASGT